jgi:hypothetical protein
MLVDDGDGVLQNLRGAVAVFLSVLMVRELLLVVAQLAEQAFAKIAAAYAGRIKLANHFQSFVKIVHREIRGLDRPRRGLRSRRRARVRTRPRRLRFRSKS